MVDLQIRSRTARPAGLSLDPAWTDPWADPFAETWTDPFVETRVETRAETWAERRAGGPHLVDTTMLFAPHSGGVKRYLTAKAAWLRRHRPGVRHTLVIPGKETARCASDILTIAAARLPFGDGYRWPTSTRRWSEHLVRLRPDVIEAGDPYGPGHAALDAGARLGAPVVGFCHSDPAALAALHLGDWAELPVRRRWARLFRRFDQVIAPSRHIADRLVGAGVANVLVQPLGVDVELFHPGRRDADGVRRELGIASGVKILMFAGRSAREKHIEVLLEASARLGEDYHLVLVGAGAGARPQRNASFVAYQRDPVAVARLLASADAFVHANDREPFGLVALEAMACGTPLVGIASGGIGELVDEDVGQLAPRAAAGPFAEAVSALFERDLAELGVAARRRAVGRHSWDATFVSLANVYGGLCGAAERCASVVVSLRPHLALAPSF